jgi:hypothetical protein
MISRMYCGINIRRTNSTTIHPVALSIRFEQNLLSIHTEKFIQTSLSFKHCFSTKKALAACYADIQVKANNTQILDDYEKTCHQEYFNMVKSMDTLLKSNPVLVF